MESHAPFPKALPRFRPPAGTTDCHLHIFGPYARFPLQPNRSFTPPEALLADYERLMKALGIERCVVVQPSPFGTDNSCTEDAVERLGPIARGVAVLGPDVEEATLKRLDRVGFRGVRLNLLFKGGIPIEAMEPLAKRLAPYGWHIQLLLDARTLPDLAPRLRALPVDIVIDHMGYMPVSVGMNSPAVDTMRRLLGEGRTWVKLSGSYAVTVDGPPMPTPRRLRARCWRRRPIVASGAPTGPIRRPRARCPTMPSCSTSCRPGPPTRHCNGSCSATIRRCFTGSTGSRSTPRFLLRLFRPVGAGSL